MRFSGPDGRVIPVVPESPEVPWPGAQTLSEENARRGLAIDAETAMPDWGGERADYGYMVSVLWQLDPASA